MTKAGEMIIGGFISKIASDVVDIPENSIKDAIRNADKKREEKNQSIETRIYQVTIDAIKEFTKREYKGRDVLYDAAESIIRGFIRNKNDKVEAARAGLKMLVSQVTTDTCEDFLKTLQHEICMDENDILYKEISMMQGRKIFEIMREGFDASNKNDEETHEKLNHVIEGINNIDKRISGTENDETKHYEVPVKNRVEEYAEKWDKNVFLNDLDEEDERTCDRANVKLREIYLEELLPSYILNRNQNLSYKLKERLKKYIVDKKDREMLLILGQPGIGKSTLITWIMANLAEKKDEIFVYQFASDLKEVNWQEENILEEIFKTLRLEEVELKNKVLILDGFDEISISDNRERILDKLSQEVEVKRSLGNFSLIITCRENYVNLLYLSVKCYIRLQAWNEDQIKCFCNIYEKKSKKNLEVKVPETKINRILEKREIFGIPLILYMMLALNIDFEKSSSIVDVYDQIFSLERGEIYNRCYDKEHRTNKPEIKKYIHQVSQKMAFWIFENRNNEGIIYRKDFKEICDTVMLEVEDKNEQLQSDTLIGSYFKVKHCDGEMADEISFVHRSIYEYFVAVYFYESVHKLTCKKNVAGKLGELLKRGILSKQILEFIKCKFDSLEEKYILDITREVFNMMLQEGMTYYFMNARKEPLSNVLVQEMRIFSNMLEIIHLWHDNMQYFDKKIVVYLRHNHSIRLNLVGADLIGAGLIGANLRGANLRRARLIEADLRGANLTGANLSGADLTKADLSGADLSGADLRGTILISADLIRADLSEADLSGACLSALDLFVAKLGKTDFNEAEIDKVNFNEVKLDQVDLSEFGYSREDLIRAIWCMIDLSGAYLYRTIFDEKQISILYKFYDLSSSSVFLPEIDKIISYKEYCTSKQED